VENALTVSGLSAQYLEIELTESCLIQQPEAIYNIFQRLRKRGVRLSVDDFGTGYSSLSYIKRLPIDKLKIDQSFVRDVATNPDDTTIVDAIISMAHSLRLKAIAEGVETEEQAEILRRLNCDEMQGFLFSKPLPADQLTALLNSKA
jgi:EAL domain-containing protein (putative c-di-GMP-specific phosphodiesterase class I)